MVAELRRSSFELSWERAQTEEEYLSGLADSPAIVLADYALPQFSGVRALELLQQQGLGIPFIVVSGTVGEEAAAEIINRGATDYVLKSSLARLGPPSRAPCRASRKLPASPWRSHWPRQCRPNSGGLGVLAGDTLRSAADMRVPIVGVSLLHRAGHFRQELDETGTQSELPVSWNVSDFLTEMPVRAAIQREGRKMTLRRWKCQVEGATGYGVPLYLLDTEVPENSEWDSKLASVLYGGGAHYRLCQEIVLGIGGVRVLRALGYDTLDRFHMNEGHASLLTLELLLESARKAGRRRVEASDLAAVRQKCVYNAHPGPSGS